MQAVEGTRGREGNRIAKFGGDSSTAKIEHFTRVSIKDELEVTMVV